MALIISNIPIIFTNLNLKEAFVTAARLNKELNERNLMERFAKYSNFYSILYFFKKRRKSVKQMIHRKKKRGHRMSKIVKSSKVIAMAICPVFFFTLLLRVRARCMTWRMNFVCSKDAQ